MLPLFMEWSLSAGVTIIITPFRYLCILPSIKIMTFNKMNKLKQCSKFHKSKLSATHNSSTTIKE